MVNVKGSCASSFFSSSTLGFGSSTSTYFGDYSTTGATYGGFSASYNKGFFGILIGLFSLMSSDMSSTLSNGDLSSVLIGLCAESCKVDGLLNCLGSVTNSAAVLNFCKGYFGDYWSDGLGIWFGYCSLSGTWDRAFPKRPLTSHPEVF